MAVRIRALAIGYDNVYVVEDRGIILVDGGVPGKAKTVSPALAAAGVAPKEVRLIVLTHGHWDHIGCAAELKRLTEAPIAMHHAERDRLEKPLTVMPPGVTAWGRIFGAFCNVALTPSVRIEPVGVDVPISDDGMSLDAYGIDGRILHTPGHSPGSLSILLASGDALVGDLAMSMFPLRIGPGLPIFAEEMPRLQGSIERLLSLGAVTIHPAHGPAFPAAKLRQALARL